MSRPAYVWLAWGLLLGLPAAATGQTSKLATDCAALDTRLEAFCQELALTAVGLQRGIGLSSSLGSDIPGSPSTLGFRLGSTPRIGLSASGMALRVGIPDIVRSSPGQNVDQDTFSLVGFRLGAAVGVVDGFQLAPTVGGVLSIDLLGSYTYARLPEGPGFTGSTSGLGLGARVGIFRESFTLPGVSVSVARRWMGDATLGQLSSGDPGEVEVDSRTTSLRATVGKNFFAIGLMGGVGWERHEGDARIAATLEDDGGTVLGTANGRLSTDRTLYFLAGWFNFLVYQVSAEVGLASGTDSPFLARSGRFDPSDRTLFASVAFRITL